MKPITAGAFAAALLAGGWMSGRWLARQREPVGNPAPVSKATAGPERAPVAGETAAVPAAGKAPDFTARWEEAMNIEDGKKRLAACAGVAMDWVAFDAPAALQALLAVAEGQEPVEAGVALMRFFGAWSQAHGWDAAFTAAKALQPPLREPVMRQLGTEAIREETEPARRVGELLAAAGEDRPSLLVSAMIAWGQQPGSDPAEIGKWIDALPPEALPPEKMASLERGAVQVWMEKNPRQAAEWLLPRTAPAQRPEALRMVVQEWVGRAPNACGEWLREQPPGPDLDTAIEAFARVVVREDGASAYAWAAQISDPARREKTTAGILEKWRQLDPDGAAAAQTEKQE